MTRLSDPMQPPVIPPVRPRVLSGNLAAIGSTVIWAAGFPAADALLRDWNPLAVAFGRFLMAAVVLVLAWPLVEGWQKFRSANWIKGMAVGAGTFGLGAYLLILAQSMTDGVTVAVITISTPITATLIEVVLHGRRLHLGFLGGLVAAIAGGLLATGQQPTATLGLGAAICIVSNILFSWGSFATVRVLPGQSALGRTVLTTTGGALALGVALAAAVLGGAVDVPIHQVSPAAVGNLVIYSIGALAISQFLWIMSVEKLGVALAAFHLNLAPFYVMMILLALGQSWNWAQAAGALVVVLGVIAAQR